MQARQRLARPPQVLFTAGRLQQQLLALTQLLPPLVPQAERLRAQQHPALTQPLLPLVPQAERLRAQPLLPPSLQPPRTLQPPLLTEEHLSVSLRMVSLRYVGLV